MSNSKVKMPLWGPYSKKYMGVSRIIDSMSDTGARYDFVVHPTLWNSSTPVPNVTFPSAYHLWSCDEDFRFFSYRYELMWKDMIYADVSYSKMNDEAYLMRCEFVNNTDLTQNCILNVFASLEFPTPQHCVVKNPDNAKIIDACKYSSYVYTNPRPWDTENPDGMHKGEFADGDFLNGHGLGDRCENYHVDYLGILPFGCEKGDSVSYSVDLSGASKPVLAVRYRTVTDGDACFSLNGKTVVFPNSDSLAFAYFEADKSWDKLEFVSQGGAGIELDFIAVCESGSEKNVSADTELFGFVPEIEEKDASVGKRINLSYDGIDDCFSILTHNVKTRRRVLESGCLEDALINRLSNGDPTYDQLRETFSRSFKMKKSDEGFFHNTVIPSIFIKPHSTHVEYIILSKGEQPELAISEYDKIYSEAKKFASPVPFNKAGSKYELSTEIMRSTLLTNLVYPVYKHGENVVHYTPGKRWDSFYTWDSGVIGTGVLEFSRQKAQYILETYLSDDDNKDFQFLLHGSLVPTQFVQYLEMLHRADDKQPLYDLYPKMKRYYDFISGKTEGSTCGKFGNGLTTTYDYWYSCSGMDDYPAQVAMIAQDKKQYLCPCISTSHTIRAAKILKMVALALGNNADAEVYDADIERMSDALNKYSWDENSGYYAYSVYDDNKEYKGIFTTDSGENYDKGMDGVYPLFAGAAKGDRREKILAHIKNPDEMWSESGISAVDMSASYYFDDGYWNGNVWMSHQWFMWKTMFDLGETDFAFAIADRALNMWKAETDFSYNTYECFGIKTQRGGWFHNFGGLSAPINIWANAYYKPGTVTVGLDVWTDYQKVTANEAEVSFKYFGDNDKYSVVITLSDAENYRVTLNGEEIKYVQRTPGCMEITLDGTVKNGVLRAEKI